MRIGMYRELKNTLGLKCVNTRQFTKHFGSARSIACPVSSRRLHSQHQPNRGAPRLDLQPDLKPSALIEQKKSSNAVEYVL